MTANDAAPSGHLLGSTHETRPLTDEERMDAEVAKAPPLSDARRNRLALIAAGHPLRVKVVPIERSATPGRNKPGLHQDIADDRPLAV